jgi:hypothetical protein
VRRHDLALIAALLAPGPALAADDLGMLFHSAEERARLDSLRRGDAIVAAKPAGATAAKPEVTGYVRRSDGRATVWINGVPVTVAGARADGLLDPRALRSPENVKIERETRTEVKR